MRTTASGKVNVYIGQGPKELMKMHKHMHTHIDPQSKNKSEFGCWYTEWHQLLYIELYGVMSERRLPLPLFPNSQTTHWCKLHRAPKIRHKKSCRPKAASGCLELMSYFPQRLSL